MRDFLKDFQKGLVSVVIPTFNRSALLKDAVLSVFHQTYRPIECVIVDDGSTDHTPVILEELKQLQRPGFSLRYFLQQNAGAQVARNTGTAASKGEFIQYLDSDDLLDADKLQKQVDYLNQHPECDGVFGDWKSGTPETSTYITAYASEDMITQFLSDRCVANFSFLMRRMIVSRIGEWDCNIKRNQEIDFHIRGVLSGGQFHYLPGCTGLWRQHNNERIANTTNLFDILFFHQKMEGLLKERNLFTTSIKQKISMKYVWYLSAYKSRPDHELIAVMKEAIRLNPDIAFYKSKKLRLLQTIAGRKISFRIWLARFRKTTISQVSC